MKNMDLQEILADETINMSIKHIVRKHGAPGYDKMQSEQLPAYWKQYGDRIKETIQDGSYVPRPIMIHYIPKADKTKKRKLGVPCMVDRMLLYAMQSVMTPHFEVQFSDRSYAFRKGKGCLDALQACLWELNRGAEYVVDLDIKSFFDKVDHNLLFAILEDKITDPYLQILLKKYIRIKTVYGKTYHINRIGLPQGSAVSPILANMFLDALDRHFEKLEIRFIRYADDIVIFCRSKSDANYLLADAENFLKHKLKLSLNQEKTKIVRSWELEYLGYSFSMTTQGTVIFSLCQKTKQKMLEQMTELVHKKVYPVLDWWKKIGGFNRGWINYYLHTDIFDMMKFLHYAEQYQSGIIRQKISSDPAADSREYLSALFESTEFSTLTGWYQKIIRKTDNKEWIERMDKIMNDVKEWRSDKNFANTDSLKEVYSHLLEKPFFYENKSGIRLLPQKQKSICSGIKENLNELQYVLIAILATGKNMTLAQLNSYLLLYGKTVDKIELRNQVDELVRKGIVERNQLCPANIQTSQDKNLNVPYVHCYRLSFDAEEYVKQVHAPYDYEISPSILAGGFGGLIYHFSTTILFNQILLNHFINAKKISFFKIADYVTTSSFQTIQIPLYLETEGGNYFFEYMYSISSIRLHYCFLRWVEFQKMHKKNITFVLISNSEYNLYKAKYWLRKETLQSSALFIHKIAFTIAGSWFVEEPGKLLSYTDLL